LRRIHSYIKRMPSLSTTVTKVLEICNSPQTSPNDLNRVISLDPVLTGQVLSLINSAYYSLPNRITSLTRAIIMLGLNTVKNLALSTAILQSLGGKDSFKSISMDDFWIHSICVGVTAKALAEIKGVDKSELEVFFVAGLLHDLGKIPLNNCFPEGYVQAVERARVEQIPLYEAENMVFEIDHNLVGEMIANKWNLDGLVGLALGNHHGIQDDDEEMDAQSVSIVALANISTNLFEVGTCRDFFPDQGVFHALLEKVDVTWAAVSELRQSVLENIEKAKVFLQVAGKRFNG